MTNKTPAESILAELERLGKPETIQLDQHCVSIEIRTRPNLLAACKKMADALDTIESNDKAYLSRYSHEEMARTTLLYCAKLLSGSEGGVEMRIIERAVLKQSIQPPSRSNPLRSDGTKTGFCVNDQYFEEHGRKVVMQLLAKYICFQDKSEHYWIDRYWYFDVEKYQSDLAAFGIDFRKAVLEPTKLPEASQ